MRRVAPAFVLVWAAFVLDGRLPSADAQPLSSAASQALQNPPDQMSPALKRELEDLWAGRARAFLGRVMTDPSDVIETQVWIDRLANRPYLHFKASGENAGYAADPRRNVVIVLFVGPTKDDINREFGDWFAPYEGGREFIRPIDFGAERAAHSNVTEDNTESVYWQQGSAFVEVRSRADVIALARETHEAGLQSGIYAFPQPVPAARPTPSATPEAPSGSWDAAAPEDDEAGWRRVTPDSTPVETAAEIRPELTPAPTPEPTPEPTPPPPAVEHPQPSPRIPSATLGLALHAALRRDEATPVGALLGAGAEIEARDSGGRTPLMTAAEFSSPMLVRRLIDSGADVNAVRHEEGSSPSGSGMTPLMIAARHGREDVVRLLLQAGAPVDTATDDGRTALDFAAESGVDGVAQLLAAAAREAAGETHRGDTDAGNPGVRPEADDTAPLRQGVGSVRVWQARLELAWSRMEVDINEDVHAAVLRAVIVEWDGRATPESTGVMGYEYWRAALADLSPNDPVTAPTPSTRLSDERVIEALRLAAQHLLRDYGAMEVPYKRRDF
jgi:hypothetical protein